MSNIPFAVMDNESFNEVASKVTPKQYKRLLNIHKLIKKGGEGINTAFLADRCMDEDGNIPSEKTIQRDIDCLRLDFNAPIEFDKSKKSFIYEDKSFVFPPRGESFCKKLEAFENIKIMMDAFKGNPLYEEAEKLLDGIANVSPDYNRTLIDRIAVPPRPDVKINQAYWDKIISSLKNNLIINFDYKGQYESEIKPRKVKPCQLLLDGKSVYLWGFDENCNDYRMFKINRMMSLVVTQKTFELPEDYSFKTHLDGGRFGAFVQGEAEEYKIEFYAYARDFVKGCTWADDQVIEDDEEKNVSVITFHSNQFNAILSWVLSQGCYAKPLAPARLVKEWKSHVKYMAEKLKND